MRRRGALCTLLGLAGSALAPARSEGCDAGVLAWGDEGVWTGTTAAPALSPLPGVQPSAQVAPAASACGIWALAGPRRVARWHRAGPGWAVAAAGDTAEPVHALQASRDGGFALAAHGQRLSLFDAQGALLRRYDGSDLARRRHGRATALLCLPQRRSFVVAWDALAEWWEIALDPAAPPLYDGLVHDYRMGEAIATPGWLGVSRTPLERPLPQPGFSDPRAPWIAAADDERVAVIHLDVRRRIAAWVQPDAALPAALLRREADRWVWWLPAGSTLHRFDAATWQPLGHEALPCRALALQAVGEAVWLLGVQEGENRLWLRRSGSWLPLPAGKQAEAMQADEAGRHVLLATGAPRQLRLLDEAARTLHAWPLPAPLRGMCWLPAGT